MRPKTLIRRWLYAPAFAEDEEQFHAGVLNVLIWITLAVVVASALIIPLLDWHNQHHWLWLGVTLTGAIIARILLQQSKIKTASLTLLLSLWIFTCIYIFTTYRQNGLSLNFIVFLGFLGGLLLNYKHGAFYLCFLLSSGTLTLYLLNRNIVFPFLPELSSTSWALNFVSFVVTTLILFSVAHYVRHTLLRAYKQEWSLARNNQKLQEEIKRREQAQQALAKSEHRYRMLFNQAPLGLFHFDGNSVIIDCNDRFVEIIGSSRQALVGMNMLEQLQNEKVKDAIRQTIESGIGYYEGNYASVTGEKETPVRVLLSRVTAVDSPEWQGVGIVEDVTERRRSEEALRRAQKLESLGVVAGGVAHDFNNLLVAMIGQMSLALLKMEADSPGYTHVEKAEKAAESAAELTRQLLVYSGHSKFERSPLSLNTVIRESEDLFRLAIPAHVTLRPQLQVDLPLIQADMGQIQQVLMNLIINGAEAIGKNPGTVTVSTARQTIPEPLSTHSGHSLAPGEYVVLTVEDDGCGMDEDTLDKIFDPFFTTKFTGRGLGLAAVLGIVRAHEAGLEVTSTPGLDTRFRIYFPQTAVSSQTSASPSSASSPVSSATILIIDDEEKVRTVAADILNAQGYRVLAAGTGEEGIVRCREAPSPVDLVLLDLSMPGLSGEETFYRLRADQPTLRILFSSGYSQSDTIADLNGQPGIAFLQKPYTARQLYGAVSRLLAR